MKKRPLGGAFLGTQVSKVYNFIYMKVECTLKSDRHG